MTVKLPQFWNRLRVPKIGHDLVWVLIKNFNVPLIGFYVIYRCNWEYLRMVSVIAVIVVRMFIFKYPQKSSRLSSYNYLRSPTPTLNFMFSITVLNCVCGEFASVSETSSSTSSLMAGPWQQLIFINPINYGTLELAKRQITNFKCS